MAERETQDTKGNPRKKRCLVTIDVAKLIDLVCENPLLYDKQHKEYKDKKKLVATWLRIIKELGVLGPPASVRWDGLCNNYRRYKKRSKAKLVRH